MSEPAAKKPRRPQYQGEPTVRQIMLRPKWLLALLGFLAVAAAFAGLAQWQLSHAVRINTEAPDSETPAPLETLNPPGTAISDHAAGYLAEVSGNWAAGDFSIVSERANQGETGYWVVGHLVTGGADPADLAVAIGWTADGERAHETVSRLNAEADPLAEITATPLLGRYNPTEAAKIPDGSQPPNSMSTMVPSQLLNLWQQQPQERVYAGFLVLHDTASQLPAYQLQQIDSVPPKAPKESDKIAADGYEQNFGTSTLPGVIGTKWGWSNDLTLHSSVSYGENFVVAVAVSGTAEDLTDLVELQVAGLMEE